VVSFAWDLVDDAWHDVLPLVRAHNKECGLLPDLECTPQIQHYLEAERRGYLRLYVMRNDTEAVGYGVFYVMATPQYSGAFVVVAQEAVYVDPRFRGRAALRFLRWQEKMLEEDEAKPVAIVRASSTATNSTRVLTSMGYAVREVHMVRYLRGGK
jgi:hypothetical protein